MNSNCDFTRQRKVYLSKALKQSGDTKKRPVVVVLKIDSVAMGDVLTCIRKKYLEPESYGEISSESFKRILQAIQIAIGIY